MTIRNKGNLLLNKRNGTIIPKKCMQGFSKQVNGSNYIICAKCKGYFRSTYIVRLGGCHRNLEGPKAKTIAGDFDVKHPSWSCRSTNKEERVFFDLAPELDSTINSPAAPTHFSHAGTPASLDIALSKDVPIQIELNPLEELTSDNFPVLLTLGALNRPTGNPTRSKVDWTLFKTAIMENLGPIPNLDTPADLKRYVGTFQNCISRSFQQATSATPIADLRDQLPNYLMALVRRKERARLVRLENDQPPPG